MHLIQRARASLGWRRGLAATAAGLGASTLMIGLAVGPASAATAGFSPSQGPSLMLIDYQTGNCLMVFENGSVGTTPGQACSNAIPWTVWTLYTTPFGGYNLVNQETQQCLDGNGAGAIYENPCNWNNSYQSWTLGGNSGFGNTLQSQGTLRCLDSNYNGNSYSSSCDWEDTYQNWKLGAP